MNAALSLRFDARCGATRLKIEQQQPPWRTLRGFPQTDGSLLVHLQNVSGGVLAGDELSLGIDVGPGAIAQVTTTGATRLYRHRLGRTDSSQAIELRVHDGALLEYLPDMLIPFAGSRHSQSTSVILGARSAIFWWETLAPGRQAMGERFEYESLHIKTSVRSADKLLLVENIALNPATQNPASLARLGPYTHAANFYAIATGEPASTWLELEAELSRFCSARSTPGDIILGSSALASDGVAMRALSVSARELPGILNSVWRIAKRFLTGRDAVTPRKVS